jgi:hypothetical protein
MYSTAPVGGVRGGYVMEHEFYRALARRVRDLAEKADPFTRRRLLNLADRYEMKGGIEVNRASAAANRPGYRPGAATRSRML